MKLMTTVTSKSSTSSSTSSSNSFSLPVSRVSVLILQLLSVSIIQAPVQTNGNVLSKKVVPICEAGCFCFGSEGNCPAYPTITDTMLSDYRALKHSNPLDVTGDPFQSTEWVSTLETGEACVVELISPDTTIASSCPDDYSYSLTTVPSLDNAIAAGQYITHTGACGACSSLQDLALMVDYPNLPYKAQQCFFRSNALADIEGAITCYEEIGFTSSCSKAFAYHQKIIVDRECGYQCAAWGFDGDLGRPSCDDASGCGVCLDEFGINTRLELVAGRTFANSGYPSQKGRQCSDVAPVDVIGGIDICGEAPLYKAPTDRPLETAAPSIAPVVPQTSSPVNPTAAPVNPTLSPVNPTAAPVNPTLSPVNPTAAPVNPTSSAVEATAKPISLVTDSPTPAPVPLSTFPASYQQCLDKAAIEERVGVLAGGNGVTCDCSDAETGETNRPKCFSSADIQCGIIYAPCGAGSDCCGNGVRSCRAGSCRTSTRQADKTTLRLSASRGGAARNRRVPVPTVRRRRGVRGRRT